MGVKAIGFNLELRLIFDVVWSIEYLTSHGVALLLRVLCAMTVESRNISGTKQLPSSDYYLMLLL